jgi:hypothetical protein
MRYWLLVSGLLLIAAPAFAQTAGEPCQTFGETIVADDKNSVLACLRTTLGDPASPLVWMLNTSAPHAWQPDDGAGSEAFYKIGPEQKAR